MPNFSSQPFMPEESLAEAEKTSWEAVVTDP